MQKFKDPIKATRVQAQIHLIVHHPQACKFNVTSIAAIYAAPRENEKVTFI
jgi:hypothetical protein